MNTQHTIGHVGWSPNYQSSSRPNMPKDKVELRDRNNCIVGVVRYSNGHVFGVHDIQPIEGLPEGRVRIRMRNDDFAWVFVKTKTCIRKFSIQNVDGKWQCGIEQAANQTMK